MKSIFKSKTFWLNLGLGVLTMATPDIQNAVSAHPAVATGLTTAGNILLRLVTHQGVNVTGE